ncbi:Ku protein [Streptomyces sp. SID2888]|uniref:non-homologous end joining protein Ku n=1 Tax=Streptomyces sp. SID2888 TaxID=2690256 RepID=UPI00136C7D46|nr:Ku protein [Streptomyces sp. SID2888]
MRSIWNGAISFGLVSIPVKLMNATENRSISFRQIHLEDDGRIRYRKFCELEDREVAQAEIGKGYQDADGTIIPVTDEDLAKLPLPTARTIEILAFVPEDRIDPLQLDNAYYLSANGLPATKPYALLREALKRSGKVAVAKYALRGRERLGMLRAADEVITMHGLLWPDEIRAPEGVAPDRKVTVREKELDLADALMDTLGDVDLDDLHDDYRTALEELITAKAEGKHLEPVAEPEGGKVLDLMAALEKSVQAAHQARSAGGEETTGEAAVRRLPKRTSAGTTPKEVGGKKSTSTAKKATGRTAPGKAATGKAATGKAATTGKATSGDTGTPKSPAKKTASKKTAANSTSTTRKPASTTAAKTTKETKATKATGEKATAKKPATKKPTAKKSTASKRTA